MESQIEGLAMLAYNNNYGFAKANPLDKYI